MCVEICKKSVDASMELLLGCSHTCQVTIVVVVMWFVVIEVEVEGGDSRLKPPWSKRRSFPPILPIHFAPHQFSLGLHRHRHSQYRLCKIELATIVCCNGP